MRSFDDQKILEALEEQISEYRSALINWARLFEEAMGLLDDARPYVEHEVEHADAKPDRDLLKAIDAMLKAWKTASGNVKRA